MRTIARRGRICAHCDEWQPREQYSASTWPDKYRPCRECLRISNRRNYRRRAGLPPDNGPAPWGPTHKVAERGRICTKCDEWLPRSEYTPSGWARRGSACKGCIKIANRRDRVFARYGLTPDAFEALVQAQGGVCALCGAPPPPRWGVLHVDHDHDTGRVRGLLCANCNTALGTFGDSVEGLYRAIAYLSGDLPGTARSVPVHHRGSTRSAPKGVVRHGRQYVS